MNNTVNIFNFYSCILIRTLVPAYPPGIPLPMAFTTDRSRLSRRAVHVWTLDILGTTDRTKEIRSNFYRFQSSSTELVLLTGFFEVPVVLGIKSFHLKRFMASLCFRYPKFQV